MPTVYPQFLARRPGVFAVLVLGLVLLLNACSGGGGGAGSVNGAALDAQASDSRVTLSWIASGASSYNLYYSTDPNCDTANYTTCAGGTMVVGVASPYTVTGLSNGQNYWFVIESVTGSGNKLSNVAGARPDQLVTAGGVTNTVYALAHDSNNVTYLGGDFTYVGRRSGYGLPLNTSTGYAGAYPVVNGAIYAAVADGNGGYYIGGAFTLVDGQTRNHLAHILANGSLDTSWDAGTNGVVVSLAVSGSTVYAGGNFISVTTTADGTLTRNHLAAINADSTLSAWDPNVNGTVSVILVSGNTVYAGGSFSSVGVAPRTNLAAINATTGVADATLWTTPPNPDGPVYALAIDSTGTVFAGGGFANIAGSSQTYLAAIKSDGTLATFPQANNTVISLAITGSTVYVGGNFTTVGADTRNYLAAISTAGTVSTWNPAPDAIVRTLTVSGTSVYAGGDFTSVAGQSRYHLAAINSDGTLASWSPSTSDKVYALAVANNWIYVGGNFTCASGEVRNRLAAINSDGSLASWNPGANGIVNAIEVSGSTIYVGGAFTTINTTTRNRLAAIDTAGTLTGWDPDTNGIVYAIAVSGSTVYVGGAFTTFTAGATTRNHLAAIDSSSGLPTSWDPDADNSIRALVVSGTTVYAGGDFTFLQNSGTPVTSNHLAAIDSANSTSSVNLDVAGVVYALALSGSSLYVGGTFTKIATSNRSRLAAFDTSANTLLSWDPGADSSVRALATYDNGSTVTIYAGGDFLNIGYGGSKIARTRLAAFDTSGTLQSWDPIADSTVYALTVANSMVHAGGQFTSIGGQAMTTGYTSVAP